MSKELFLYPEPAKMELLPGTVSVPAPIPVSGFDAAKLEALFGDAACATDPETACVHCHTGKARKGGDEAYTLRIAAEGIDIESPSATTATAMPTGAAARC